MNHDIEKTVNVADDQDFQREFDFFTRLDEI